MNANAKKWVTTLKSGDEDNDVGASFKEIAEIIESEPEGLFA